MKFVFSRFTFLHLGKCLVALLNFSDIKSEELSAYFTYPLFTIVCPTVEDGPKKKVGFSLITQSIPKQFSRIFLIIPIYLVIWQQSISRNSIKYLKSKTI